MVKKRLIATLLYRDGKLVQSINFKHPMAIGNAITKIDFYNTWTIDEIILLDISREKKDREQFFEVVDGLSRRSFVPLTVGGWIESYDEIKQLLNLGADKITINSIAFKKPDFITEAAGRFGSQCIVTSIDAKISNNRHEVFINRGNDSTGIDVIDWAKKVEKLGSGEIFLTSIDNDGSRKGYDLKLMNSVTKVVSVPVIAFGGVWTWDHLVDGINIGNVDAIHEMIPSPNTTNQTQEH
jgi:cyclase